MRKYPFTFESKADVKVGLIGSGIQESRSPRMHMREAEAQGFTLDYRLFDLEDAGGDVSILPGLLDKIESAGYTGINVTHPCKQTVINCLDELSPEASDLGAVNTVIFSEGKRTGHNTDWSGFYSGFNKSLPGVDTDKVLQLGAGGAGSAVAYALSRIGVEVLYLFDLDAGKSKQLVDRLAGKFTRTDFHIPEHIEPLITDVNGIINTTPVGMKSYPGLPLPGHLLSQQHWIVDVIYFPLETGLLRKAREKGCKTMDGSGMAINQAADAFRLFTGKQADNDRMYETFFNPSD